MRGCSCTDEYEAGKEKNHSILTTKKLDYTTASYGCLDSYRIVSRFKVLLFVTYSIIQDIISSEM